MKDYRGAGNASLAGNYVFSALAGITWYLQFMFYGMGTTKMGRYDFSSWTMHMAFPIVFIPKSSEDSFKLDKFVHCFESFFDSDLSANILRDLAG